MLLLDLKYSGSRGKETWRKVTEEFGDKYIMGMNPEHRINKLTS